MDPNDILRAVVSPENLQWAWQKVIRQFKAEPAWKNAIEIASFEIDLANQLQQIAFDLTHKNFKLLPIKPIPQPKRNKETNELGLRQLFWIPVRDQVAWVAIINIIGPIIDARMPLWSFGNRLHRPAWYDESDEGNKLKVGPYRHTSGLLYRKFAQSWPLYRRYAYLTLRQIANGNSTFELDDTDKSLLESEFNLPDSKKMPYLRDDYWNLSQGDIYWAAIDFEKFYPNLQLKLVHEIMCRELSINKEHQLSKTLTSMMEFPVDYTGFSDAQLEIMGLDRSTPILTTLPTGLMVAGFLANVAMLEVDRTVTRESVDYQIAHYRYVDDHLILGNDFDQLVKWLMRYRDLINASNIAKLNLGKTEPEPLVNLFSIDWIQILTPADSNYIKAKEASLIDPVYPKPLMTKTLSRVSQLARLDFEFLDEGSQAATLNDLELLLLADIGDSEIPETTRISFAATLLTRFSALTTPYNKDLYDLSEIHRKISEKQEQENALLTELENIDSAKLKVKLEGELEQLRSNELAVLKRSYKKLVDEIEHKVQQKYFRSYDLLIKALHENPEKLRLWQRALDFCLATGHHGISKLQAELKKIKGISHTSGVYIESLLFSCLSENIVVGLSKLQYQDISESHKEKIISFIFDVIQTLPNWEVEPETSYYYLASYQLLLKTASGVLEGVLLYSLIHHLGTEPERALVKIKDLSKQVDYFKNRYPYSIDPSFNALWLWWVETITVPHHANKPSNIWQLHSTSLDVTNDLSWRVWQKYPRQLPNIAVESILAGNKKFSDEYDGWLIDVIRDRVITFDEIEQFSPAVNTALRTIASYEQISLLEWVRFIHFIDKNENFDPRTGEWTSLEIIRKIIGKLIETEASELTINPANIFLPMHWKDLSDDVLLTEAGVPTWESWKKLCSQDNQFLFHFNNLAIKDFRFSPASSETYVYEPEWLRIRAVGLLLLGLLRKSFDWPGLWNIPDQAIFLHSSAKSFIGNIACSSYTTGILEACLLARSRESYLISFYQDEINRDSDTTYDPPPIESLHDLLNSVKHAQSILESYQFSVQAHKPIQLIPLNIEQLSRYINDNNLEATDVNE